MVSAHLLGVVAEGSPVRRLKLGRYKEGVALASTPAIHFELGSLPTQALRQPQDTQNHTCKHAEFILCKSGKVGATFNIGHTTTNAVDACC